MAAGRPTRAHDGTIARPSEERTAREPSRSALRSLLPSVAAGVTALGLVVFLAWRAGGYFAPDLLVAGAIAFFVLAVVVVVRKPPLRLSVPAMLGLGSLALLAGWTGLSAGWSPDPDGALHAMQRDVVHVGFLALGLLAVGSGRYARQLVWAVLGVALVVVLAGLASRVAPGLVHGGRIDPSIDSYRLAYPLGYWNAFGALAAFAAVLGLGLAADPRTPPALRAATCGSAVLAFVAMYLSLSRGAWLALGVGLVVLVVLGAHRGSLLVTTAVTGAAGAIAVVLLHSYPALVTDPRAGSGQARQADAYLPHLLIVVAIAVIVMALVAAGRASPAVMGPLGRVRRPAGLALGAVIVLVAVGGYATSSGSVESAATDFSSFLSRQWRDFLHPGALAPTGTARLTSARGTRSQVWGRALDGFAAHPLRGDGGGGFAVRWMRTRSLDEKVDNAHSLEIETLGELGVVGGVLLATFLGSLVAGAVRSRRRPVALTRAQAAAVGAACSVWLAHSAVDWDWQETAFTGLVLVLAATLLPVGRDRRRGSGAGHATPDG